MKIHLLCFFLQAEYFCGEERNCSAPPLRRAVLANFAQSEKCMEKNTKKEKKHLHKKESLCILISAVT